MLTSKNECYKNSFIALGIFILIIIALGIPFTKWGFKTDDWANILHSKLNSLDELKNLFTEGNMESINHPSNSLPDRGSFLQGLYRPLSFVYYYPQTLLFGTKAYGYFLTTIMLHALNASLFFLILRYFFGMATALFGALFFGFHPSLQNWLGWISAQTYFIELLILGFIFICFYQWLETNKWQWLIGSGLLLFLNLMLKEAGIVFPAWACLAIFFYYGSITKKSILRVLQTILSFIPIIAGYCWIRLQAMPFSTANTTTLGFSLSWQSFISKQIARVMQFLTYSYDILGLSWLPKGNRLLNGFIMLTILICLGILLLKSKRKKLIFFCLISTIIFSWPGLLMHYQPRYMYMALPWMIAALILLFKSLPSFYRSKNVLYTLLTACIFLSTTYIVTNMKEREFALHWLDREMRALVTQTLPAAGWQQEPLYFFGLPVHWFDMGTAQAVWFLDNAPTNAYPVYQNGPSICMPTQNHARAIPQTKAASIDTKFLSKNTIEISSTNELLLKFSGPESSSKILTTIQGQLIKNGLWIITWDYEHGKFKILKFLS